MSYCSGQQISDLIGMRPAQTPDQSSVAIADRAQFAADELTAVINLTGHRPVPNASEAQIITAANPSKLLAYEGINGLLGVHAELEQRGNEIDVKYLKIAESHKAFLCAPLEWMRGGQMRALWDTTHRRYPIPTHRPSTRSIVFTGTGSNNLTSAGIYSGQDNATYTIRLLSSTTLQWKKNTGDWTGPVTITGAAQLLTDDITITIPTGTHNASDQWIISVKSWASTAMVAVFTPGWKPEENESIKLPAANKVLDWFTVFVYTMGACKYNHTNITDKAARKYGEIISKGGSAMVLQAKALRDKGGGQISVPALNRINEFLDLVDKMVKGDLKEHFK